MHSMSCSHLAVGHDARQVCFEDCAAEDSLYFALLAGRICVCGNDAAFLEEEKKDGTCESPCSGDATLTCGGGDDDYELYGEVSPCACFFTA